MSEGLQSTWSCLCARVAIYPKYLAKKAWRIGRFCRILEITKRPETWQKATFVDICYDYFAGTLMGSKYLKVRKRVKFLQEFGEAPSLPNSTRQIFEVWFSGLLFFINTLLYIFRFFRIIISCVLIISPLTPLLWDSQLKPHKAFFKLWSPNIFVNIFSSMNPSITIL